MLEERNIDTIENGRKSLHWLSVKRRARTIGPICISKEYLRIKLKHCLDITEEERGDIFNRFWYTINWDQRKVYVANHINTKSIDL